MAENPLDKSRLDDMDITSFRGKATYEQIKIYVADHTGLKGSSLNISQVKRKCGLEVGESYNIDMCVGVVCFVMVLVVAINIFSFVTLRIELDEIADNVLEAATESGAFSTEYK